MYHFGLLLLEGTKALPPANDAALGFHQVSADLMEALLLLSGPEHNNRLKTPRRLVDAKVNIRYWQKSLVQLKQKPTRCFDKTAKKETTKCDKFTVVCHSDPHLQLMMIKN